MITVNGKDIEKVAPVKIDDIRVSPIAITPVARQRFGFGQDFVRMKGSSRTITIVFALLIQNRNERYAALQSINEWAKPYKSITLALPMYDDRHFECVCTSYPEPSYRQWWEAKLRLVFETFDNPYWTSDDEIKARCGSPFTIGGSAPPLMRIERTLTSRLGEQTWSFGGKSMVFSQIPAGGLVIDLNKQTAAVSGTSIMQYFTTTSKFIDPQTGNINISGSGLVIYRERWI